MSQSVGTRGSKTVHSDSSWEEGEDEGLERLHQNSPPLSKGGFCGLRSDARARGLWCPRMMAEIPSGPRTRLKDESARAKDSKRSPEMCTPGREPRSALQGPPARDL